MVVLEAMVVEYTNRCRILVMIVVDIGGPLNWSGDDYAEYSDDGTVVWHHFSTLSQENNRT